MAAICCLQFGRDGNILFAYAITLSNEVKDIRNSEALTTVPILNWDGDIVKTFKFEVPLKQVINATDSNENDNNGKDSFIYFLLLNGSVLRYKHNEILKNNNSEATEVMASGDHESVIGARNHKSNTIYNCSVEEKISMIDVRNNLLYLVANESNLKFLSI